MSFALATRSLATAVAAGLVLAGCGDGPGDASGTSALSPDQQLLAEAALRTNALKQPQVAEMSLETWGGAAGRSTLVIEGSGDPVRDVSAAAVRVGRRHVEIRIVGDRAWLRGVAGPERTDWLEADASALEDAGLVDLSGRQPELLLMLGADEIAPQADIVKGDETLRSFAFSIDRERAVAAAPERDQPRVAATIAGPPDSSYVGTVAIDRSGLVREFTVRGETTADSESGAEGIELELERSPLEGLLRVEPPAASDVERILTPEQANGFFSAWLRT